MTNKIYDKNDGKIKPPLVSVVIPAYNASATILDSISSALEQSRVRIEVIVVDDCSTDDTELTLKSLISEGAVKYYRNEKNMGVAYSRNLGVRMAKGEYIALLDADDIWLENKIYKQLKLMEETGAVICGTARRLMSHDGRPSRRVISVPKSVDYKELLCGNVINCSSVFIKRELMLKHQMTDDDIHEDYLAWLRILKDTGGTAAFLKRPYLLYRMSKNSKSGDKLKSAAATYKVYRRLGLPVCPSLYYFGRYALSAASKYVFS